MADVDILIGIGGLRASAADLDTFRGRIERFSGEVSQAMGTVTGLDNAFREFNLTGQVSVSTIASLAAALPTLVNPVVAVTAALGVMLVLFKQIGDVRARAAITENKTELAELNRELAKLEALQAAGIGLSGEDLSLAQSLVDVKTEQSDATRVLTDSLSDMSKEIIKANTMGEQFMRWMERIGGVADLGGVNIEKAAASTDRLRKAGAELRDVNRLEQAAHLATKDAIQTRIRALQTLMDKQVDAVDVNAAFVHSILSGALMGGAMTENRNERDAANLAEARALADQAVARDALVEAINNQIRAEEQLAILRDEAIELEMVMADVAANTSAIVEGAIADVAVGAYESYIEALNSSTNAQKGLEKLTIQSLKGILKAVLETIGREAAIQSILEAAKGLAALAVGSPTSAIHFASAAAFGAVAAGAGFASSRIPSASAGGTSSTGDRGQIGGSGGTVNQFITVIGVLDDRQAGELAEQLDIAREERDLAA